MRKYTRHILVWITVVAYSFFLSAPAVLAAPAPASTPQNTANNGQALEIAPPVIYISADPGQTVKTQIFIRDISSGNLIVNGQVNNFVSGGEDGTPKIILDKKDDANNAYSLVEWVAPLPSLLLIPREIKSMTATINVPKDASPGGHYGVIRFTSTPPSVEGGSGVSLAASIGVLVLLTVSGKVTEGLSVQELSVSHNGKKGSFFESGPLEFLEKFKNTGNVHVQPVGQVTITDMFGKKFAAVNVNLPPGNILPQSVRQFKQPLDKAVIGNKRLFGRYTAKLTVTYGTNKKQVSTETSFWVIPYRLVAAIIAVLIGAFFVLRFLIKRYNRRILEQAQRRK
ncbi:hypothetical protein BH10PAT3_BH10PAT3_8040 [soil metagenome]